MNHKSEELINRIQACMGPWSQHITGGYCFLYKGKMCVGETKERLMVRVVSEKIDEILQNPYAKPMDFTGKPMKEFLFVSEKGYDTEEKLQH
jgi:TfoX/Sxy family transcriptional regulator of competence genes